MILAFIIGVWFIVIGLYSFYFANNMKKSGNIKAGWMVSRNIQLTDCKDIPSYITYTYSRTLVFASLVILFSLMLIIGESIQLHLLSAISILALGIIYIWYSACMNRAQKKYLTQKLKKRTGKF